VIEVGWQHILALPVLPTSVTLSLCQTKKRLGAMGRGSPVHLAKLKLLESLHFIFILTRTSIIIERLEQIIQCIKRCKHAEKNLRNV
jgi:hypothetical protein